MLIFIYIIFMLLFTIFYLKDLPIKTTIKKYTIYNYKNGEQLLFKLSTINVSEEFFLPEYKFYTFLITNLMDFQKKFGVKIRNQIKELRENLIVDLKFEKQIECSIFSALIQFIMITIITWFFIFISQNLISFKVDFRIYLLIIFLQLFGIVVFSITSLIIKQKMFKDLNEGITEMIAFKSLYEVGIPINQINSQLVYLPKSLHKSYELKNLSNFFFESIQRLEKYGQSPKEDFDYIITELFSEMTNKLAKFKKILGLSKFLHLAFLYLPAYFLYLAAIYKFFMEQ